MGAPRILDDLLAHVFVLPSQKRGWHLWALILQPCSLQPSSLTSWPRREWFWQDFLSIEIIYSCLPQPYGVVSQKALTFLRFEPASLQSAIQLLNVLAMEALNQYQSCQSKKELHFGDLNLQPSKLQSSALTFQPCRWFQTHFFHGHYLQLAPSTL